MEDFITQLPKAELHLHIEGTLEPHMMLSLAKRNGIKLPYSSLEAIQKAYQFKDLQSFLDVYYLGAKVLMTEQDFYDLTMAYFEKMHQDHVQHVELFFDPQTHTDRGIPFDVFFEGIDRACQDAKRKFNITSHKIMCFLRHLPQEQAFKTLEDAKPYHERILGVGLDSAEGPYPPQLFTQVFKAARQLGFKTFAHAGEEGGPDYIWQALEELKILRIDHGVRAIEDPLLMEYLIQHQIPLTMCPLSNLALKVTPNLKDHPLKQMLEMGVKVTINSDDPAYFGGYLVENYLKTAQALKLSKAQLSQIADNSVKASYLDEF